MFGDHGKQDNSLFSFYSKEQTLRGVQDRSYKICHFCEGHSL